MHILLARIKPLLLKNADCSSRDSRQVAALLTLFSLFGFLLRFTGNFVPSLDMFFIYLKAAFDSVNRAALWKSLERIVAPAAIRDLVRDLYSHTTSPVRIGDEFSPLISATSGVRQGCVLALISFAVQSTG